MGGPYHGKHRASEPDASGRRDNAKHAGKSNSSKQTSEHKERSLSHPTQSKSSKFPSLTKIGRSHTFSFRKKSKAKDTEAKMVDPNDERYSQDFSKSDEKGSRTTTHDASKKNDKTMKSFDDKLRRQMEKTAKQEGKRVHGSARHAEVTRSRSQDSRPYNEGKEDRSPARGYEYSSTYSYNRSSSGKHHKSPRRKDCKRKEAPIDRSYDYDNVPLWLRNPPKILIQDFSSDYVDETTFDEEYFDLVQWAFRILEQHCDFSIHPEFIELEFDDGAPTILGDVPLNGKELPVITNETARVGSTLDYILHPISTGAANVMQTGAKFADFTSRVFRGINFDSIIKKRSENNSNDKK